MMKTLLNIFFLLVIANAIGAQTSEKFSYQAIIRDATATVITNTNVSMRLSILKDTETGIVVYSETHNTTTNFSGVVTVIIGNGSIISGDLNIIDWGTSPHFIKSEIDITNGTNYNIVGTTALLSTPYGLSSKKADVALSVDYNNLTNSPITVSTNQISKLDFLTATSAADLTQLKSKTAVNTSKASFPGFGTTTGNAFDIIWSKIDDNLYYDTGKVGIGYADASNFGNAVLGIKDGLVLSLDDAIITPTPGTLFYDKSATGFIFYYDNMGDIQSLGTNQIVFNRTSNIFNVDTTIKGSTIVGSSASTGVDFGENDLILASSTPSIYFEDTSGSASFPSKDWLIKINDYSDNGENYFAILDTAPALTQIPFKIMATAPNKALDVHADGNISLGDLTPVEKLELDGIVSATSFVGDGANLTNIIGGGTASITNTGSTTIAADSDTDTIGAIKLNTNLNGLFIESDGTVHNGTADPSLLLNINGDAKFNSLTAKSISIQTYHQKSVLIETSTTNFSTYDITGKEIVLLNNSTNISLVGFSGAVKGQKVCFININPTSTFNFVNGFPISPASIPNNLELSYNESFTIIYDGSSWICTDYIVAP